MPVDLELVNILIRTLTRSTWTYQGLYTCRRRIMIIMIDQAGCKLRSCGRLGLEVVAQALGTFAAVWHSHVMG